MTSGLGARWWTVPAVLVALAAGTAAADPAPVGFTKESLPPRWTIERETEIPRAHVAPLETKLGGRIARLTQQVVSINGLAVQLNLVECPSTADADAIDASMQRLGRGDFVRRRGTAMVEVRGTNRLIAKRVFAALAPPPPAWTRYEAVFRLACVDELDYMEATPLLNLFMERDEAGPSEERDRKIREMIEDWKFGTSLRLRTREGPGFRTSYTFDPKPVRTVREGASTRFVFADPPRVLGIPYVDVVATVDVQARYAAAEVAEDEGEAGPTSFWPVRDDRVAALAKKLTAGAPTQQDRLLALLRFASLDIRYGGEGRGTRYGVARVLEQQYGHCWDKSDVLVTLARAAGLPARQVAGWVPSLTGHVWTEIRIPGEGWWTVDPTCSWLGTSEDYIPFFETDDGAMPIAYLGLPSVREVER